MEVKEKSITNKIIDEFINSLKEVEDFDNTVIESLAILADRKQLSNA